MADKLTEFLTRNDACIEVLVRLAATGAASRAAAREQQARWIRTNFKLADLRTN